ncbi:hypothetical protein [Providencia huaxiensis]|uniref:hypothetical protein n=1 Tax=Providencia huaxiensis TaxID=2027290 RepID=UPI0032DBE31F
MRKNSTVKNPPLLIEIGKIIIYPLIVFSFIFIVAKEKLEFGSFWYSASYYFIEIASLIAIVFLISTFRFGVSSIENPVRYWKERGYLINPSSDEYYELFEDFSLNYYSSENIKNRISDAFYFLVISLDFVATIVAGITYWEFSYRGEKIIDLISFLPQLFLVAYFILSVPVYLICKIITNRYPGEAMKARRLDSVSLLDGY